MNFQAKNCQYLTIFDYFWFCTFSKSWFLARKFKSSWLILSYNSGSTPLLRFTFDNFDIIKSPQFLSCPEVVLIQHPSFVLRSSSLSIIKVKPSVASCHTGRSALVSQNSPLVFSRHSYNNFDIEVTTTATVIVRRA